MAWTLPRETNVHLRTIMREGIPEVVLLEMFIIFNTPVTILHTLILDPYISFLGVSCWRKIINPALLF